MGRIITLLTDYGTADGYVAELKGVLLSQAPDATLIDISHDIRPQDIEGARLALTRYWRRYPAGTVHLVVVDPGVGTDRAALAVSSSDYALVGPDNGVLSPGLFAMDARVVALPVPSGASHTFHGRDVFAPAAARLASGVPVDELGPAYTGATRVRTPEPVTRDNGTIVGEVLTVDRFGNAVTNIMARAGGWLEASDTMLPVVRTYAEVAPKTLVGVVGSSGLLEVAQRDGNGADAMGLRRGSVVVWHPPER